MGWTEERVESLKRMWADDDSAGKIAERLGGVTRDAVIGKIYRLGLQRSAGGGKAARVRGGKIQAAARSMAAKVRFGKGEVATPAPPPAKPPRNKPVHVSAITGAIIPGPAPLPPQPLPAAAPASRQMITTLEITAKTCCWPENDGAPEWLFCGGPRDPKSGNGERGYCTAHHRRSVGRAA